MAVQFVPERADAWFRGDYDSSDTPKFYLSQDGKILKKVLYGRTTYHLPETHMVVAFQDLGAAFLAAYGKPMED